LAIATTFVVDHGCLKAGGLHGAAGPTALVKSRVLAI
jgi:hypothetical protein